MGTEAFHGDGGFPWGRGLSTQSVPVPMESLRPRGNPPSPYTTYPMPQNPQFYM